MSISRRWTTRNKYKHKQALIPQDTVDKILSTAEIVDVVSDFVTLKRRGQSYLACCPFHNEKTPSFVVTPSRGIYKCFGCGKAGTAVGFVMDHENMTYPEALRYLAKKYNIEIQEKEESAEEIAARQRKDSLIVVSEFASEFFCEALQEGEGRSIGYQYLKSRGLEDDTIRKWRLGWAPSSRHAFVDAAAMRGFKTEYLVETGLCIQYDDGRTADRFYDRVIFPIHSLSGSVIAYGGRTLRTDKSVAKYVNSPQSQIYDKSNSLYGIWFAKNSIAREDKCIMVEGYLDVLSMHQLGITNVVASSGTSLTVQQVRMIHRFTTNITIMYDGDPAGIHAALRGIDLVLKEGMNVKVVLIPDGDDPDSYCRKHTFQEVKDFIAGAEQDFISFKTELLLGQAADDPQKRFDAIADIADSIAGMPDAVKRSVYAQTIAKRFDMDLEIIQGHIATTREHMAEEDRKAKLREQNRSGVGSAQTGPHAQGGGQAPSQEAPAISSNQQATAQSSQSLHQQIHTIAQRENLKAKIVLEDPDIAPCEEELLWLVLNYGTTPLKFESDSPFYEPGEDPPTVADLVRNTMEEDGRSFMNLLYRHTYDNYFKAYDNPACPPQDTIVKMLLNGEDRQVANCVIKLIVPGHKLSVRALQSSMTSQDSFLVRQVPRSIRAYHIGIIDGEMKDCVNRIGLTSDVSEQDRILGEMKHLAAQKTEFEQELGRAK